MGNADGWYEVDALLEGWNRRSGFLLHRPSTAISLEGKA
jgi:hypothetical protein